MLKIKDWAKLLRISQWYKNVVIFISIIFSFNLLNLNLLILTIFGFIALCLISSSAYIINDLADIEKDKHHPEKKKRPLPSGKIKKTSAFTIAITLFLISTIISAFLSLIFLACVLALFILSLTYTAHIRNKAYLDLLLISINFVIRAVSGNFIINSEISYWVILCTFFISTFLVSSKRLTELNLKNIKEYRPSYSKNDKSVLEFLIIMSVTCVFVFFAIYCILNNVEKLLISIPIALYIVIMFLREIYLNPKNIRNPEKFIFKEKILISITLWLMIILWSFYT